MNNDDVESAFNICVSICGQDGVISHQEEEAIIDKFKSLFELGDDDFDDLFDNFFATNDHIDSYLEKVTNVDLQRKILLISEYSAAIDGFDVRENIAFQRVKLVWGIS